jgi:release factor glutamine methyltransferase
MTTTIREAYLQASSFLEQTNSEQDAGRVVRWMLEHVLGMSSGELLMAFDHHFPENNRATFDDMIRRKAAGEPVQYILGEAAFMDLMLDVTPAVLIPRPETELLVEAVEQAALARFGAHAPVRIVDVGTGSGTIPVTLAVHQPTWTATAVDLSSAALEVASRNAVKYGVEGRLTFMEGDLLEPILANGMAFDILISNPPYIPSGELVGLQAEVQHEPMLALDGGEDGLILYRRMIDQVVELPVKPSIIAFELGIHQADIVAGWIRASLGWTDVKIIYDLQGIGRHIIAQV